MYRVIGRQYVFEGTRYLGYGISCPCREIEDITTDYYRLARLVKLCNELQLDPVHLDDVVEDFLCGLGIV